MFRSAFECQKRAKRHSVPQQLHCLMSSHRVMHINVCTHHTHISSFYTVVMSSVAPQECWQTRHVTSREPRAPCKTEFSKRDQICGLLKLKAAGRITALVNSTGVQSNKNKTQASQHSSHLHYGSDESFVYSGKRQGFGRKRRRAKSFPQRRAVVALTGLPWSSVLRPGA